MSNIVSIIIVAVLGVIGNIAYFEYQLHKKSKKEIIKERLSKLLLPLYLTFEDDEINSRWYYENDDPILHEAEKPIRLFKELRKVIYENIYLADDELHNSLLDFLNWAMQSNIDERFQEFHKDGIKEEDKFKKLHKIVIKKYNQARKQYLN